MVSKSDNIYVAIVETGTIHAQALCSVLHAAYTV